MLQSLADVPAGPNGCITVFVTNRTHVVIDVMGYFPEREIVIPHSPSCKAIKNAIDSAPPEGATIVLSPGTYTCSEPVVLDRDNLTLRGTGPSTILRLANGANAPVVVIGQTQTPPAVRRNIRLSDLTIDGNRQNQTFECYLGPCSAQNPLRNNGITLRHVEDVVVEKVYAKSARSGGMVTELV